MTNLTDDDRKLLDEVITYCESTPDESWWPGPTYRSPDGTRHCVLAHIEDHWGMKTMDLFEETWANSYTIGRANDGEDPRFPQATPKARSLAYLYGLRDGSIPDMETLGEQEWERYKARQEPDQIQEETQR